MDVADLNEGIIAVAFATMAVCAIVAVCLSWRRGRQQVILEAFETVKGDHAGALELTLAVTVSNRRRSSVQPLSLEVRGLPNVDVSGIDGGLRNAGQAPNTAPFSDMPVPPFESREASFLIGLDWQEARIAAPNGGDLRWQAIVTFSDRRRGGTRWSQTVDLAFQTEELHRLTSSGSTPVERRGPRRPFSGPTAMSGRGLS